MKQAICTNFGNCTKADDPDRLKHLIQISEGADFVCPQCGAPLTLSGKGPATVFLPMLLAFAVLVFSGIGVGAWFLLRPKPSSPASPLTVIPPPFRPSPPPLAAVTPTLTLTPVPTPEATPTPRRRRVPDDPRLEYHRLKAYCFLARWISCVRKVGPISPALPARTPTSIRSRAWSPA